MAWITPKTNWASTQQGIGDADLNRIEGNILLLGDLLLEDLDNNYYPAIKIGDLLWTTKNFQCTKFSDGTAIPVVSAEDWPTNTDPGRVLGTCHFFYGRHFYSWQCVDPTYSKTLAPDGWRVATYDDWSALISLGGEAPAQALRAQQTWQETAIPVVQNNASGMSIFSTGYIEPGADWVEGSERSYLWAPRDGTDAYTMRLEYDSQDADLLAASEAAGMCVRLVKDA